MKEININKIKAIRGDCMEFMSLVPDFYYDLAIVDPPYGLGIDGQRKSDPRNPKHGRKYHERKGWDNKRPSKEYFKELFRVSKNQIIWGGNYFVENLKPSKGWIIWDKMQHNLTMSDCELAYSSFNQKTRVIEMNRVKLLKQGTIHPTEKPVLLYRKLLQLFANKDDKILDTHGGSMSIGLACIIEDLNLTIIELDKDYYRKAVERMRLQASQKTLF